MLTKNDKKWMKDTFNELITEALTVEVEMVQTRDSKTGLPLKTEKHVNKEIFLPDFWVEFLPFFEQSIVAMEKVTEQARNRSNSVLKETKELQTKVEAIGQLYIALEKPLKAVAALSDVIQNNQLPTMQEHLNLVYDESDSA